jgi:hypothetical protein
MIERKIPQKNDPQAPRPLRKKLIDVPDDYVPPQLRQENYPKHPVAYHDTQEDVQEFLDFLKSESEREQTQEEKLLDLLDIGIIDVYGDPAPEMEGVYKHFNIDVFIAEVRKNS